MGRFMCQVLGSERVGCYLCMTKPMIKWCWHEHASSRLHVAKLPERSVATASLPTSAPQPPVATHQGASPKDDEKSPSKQPEKQAKGLSNLCADLRPELQACIVAWFDEECISSVRLLLEDEMDKALFQHLGVRCPLKIIEQKVLTKRLEKWPMELEMEDA